MAFQPGATLYAQSIGTRPENVEVPHIEARAPTSTDIGGPIPFPIGKSWVDTLNSAAYVLTNLVTVSGLTTATWVTTGGGAGAVATLTGDSGTATPVAGNIFIDGIANQIVTAGSAGTLTVGLPSAVTAPGSLATTTTLAAGTSLSSGTTITAGTSVAATTSVTAGTTVTATLGNITATNGNFVGSAAGTGILLNSPAASAASPGPVVVNGRSGQATFTSVSIAAAADLTLTITNSAITGATTQVIYSMSGSTTGSAPSIKSVTNSAGSSALVITNGTGATTTTADIVLNFIVLN